MITIHITILVLLFLSAYSYAVYPVLLGILGIFIKKDIKKAECTPTLSIIICAYNEEKNIRSKIENTLALRYPEDKCQIIIVSDGSTDATDQIIQEYPRIQFKRPLARGGKEQALRYALSFTTGEIIVFSDVATRIDADALLTLVKNFNDPSIGVVSSTDKFITESGTPAGEGVYVKYEMFLRKLETKVKGLIGVSGSFFAARKEVCHDWPEDVASDFNTVLNGIKLGYRAVSDPDVAGYYPDLKEGHSEFPRKIRTVITGFGVFFNTLEIMNVFKYGLYAWEIFSHKLMRWLVPWFLLLLFVVSTIGTIQHDTISTIMFALQLLFYSSALLGKYSEMLKKIFFIKIPFYFMEVNAAIAVAWLQYAAGKRVKMWEPSKR